MYTGDLQPLRQRWVRQCGGRGPALSYGGRRRPVL